MNLRQIFKERRSTILSAVLAVVIILVGFLAFTTLSSKPTSKTEKKTTKQVSQNPKAVSNSGQNVDASQHSQTKDSKSGQVNATKHTVVSGESLSEIAKTYYGDGNKWNLIASENKIVAPNVIHKGNVLTIPGVSSSSTALAQKPTTTPTVNQPKTYLVKHGDSLWSISQLYNNGDGYQWFKIRDANLGKVGLLPNGRPLIAVGTVLTIPSG